MARVSPGGWMPGESGAVMLFLGRGRGRSLPPTTRRTGPALAPPVGLPDGRSDVMRRAACAGRPGPAHRSKEGPMSEDH